LPRLKSPPRIAPVSTHAGSRAPARPQTEGRPPRYDRNCDLPRLIQIWPRELDDRSQENLGLIVRKLRTALRAERQRGLAGHWTYDVARHSQLLVAYRIELRRLNEKRPHRTARALQDCKQLGGG